MGAVGEKTIIQESEKGWLQQGWFDARRKITFFFMRWYFFWRRLVGPSLNALLGTRRVPPFVAVCFFLFLFFSFLRPFRQDLAGEGPCGGWGGPWPTYTYLDNPNMSPKWSGMVPGPKWARACPGRFWSWDHPDHSGGFTTI